MPKDEQTYSPPAGSPAAPRDESSDRGSHADPDRLPPPAFVPGVKRRAVHRAPHLPPAGSSLPRDVVFEPDDPPRSRRGPVISPGRERRADGLATLLETLAEELRQTRTLRFGANPGADHVEASLRGFLSGVLVSGSHGDEG